MGWGRSWGPHPLAGTTKGNSRDEGGAPHTPVIGEEDFLEEMIAGTGF